MLLVFFNHFVRKKHFHNLLNDNLLKNQVMDFFNRKDIKFSEIRDRFLCFFLFSLFFFLSFRRVNSIRKKIEGKNFLSEGFDKTGIFKSPPKKNQFS